MNDSATQQQPSRSIPLGANEAQAGNRIFVNLRIGRIAQTSKDEQPGFFPAQTKNKDGSVNSFFAKAYKNITGFVNDIYWHSHQLSNGTTLLGWNVVIDTMKEVYVLGVSTKDRPYQNMMSCLVNADFSRPIMFAGFMGDQKKKVGDKWVPTGEKQKMLLLSQEINPETGKEIWIKPAYEPKFLSRLLIDKLKEGIVLTEYEENNVSRMADGKFNKEFPYIVEEEDKSNGNWDFRAWNKFLKDQMEETVIPEMKVQAQLRANSSAPVTIPDEDIPGQTAYSGLASGVADDDIPF